MYGWTGKILHLDLENRRFHVETPSQGFYASFIGGRGMGGYYLRPQAHLDWDHPDMIVAIFTGPLNATISPTPGRTHIISKSPLTGLMADSSVGGKLATQLKRAGWDGLVLRGKSPFPLGINIHNDQIEFLPAETVWGLETHLVHKSLNPGKASLACIGPAGENRVRFAAINVDRHHLAGRTGLGLCLGEKKLKYLLIRGTGRTRVKNPALLKKAREDILRLTSASPALMGKFGLASLGTGAIFDLMDNRRMMPTNNFRATAYEHAGKLNAPSYASRFSPKKFGCRGCHILCKKMGKTKNRPVVLPEFETMSHFTALVGCADKDLVVLANERCAQLGMDTISMASVLACRREILDQDYTPETLLSLIENTAQARGQGKALGLGAMGYAGAMGRPGAAMAVKGLELPAYDPRGAYGMALGYALSTRGGCHLRAYPISHEILRKPVATDRFSFSGKARIIKISEDLNAVVDSLIACKFIFFAAGLEEYANAYAAVTGISSSAQDLLEKGERIYYNEKIINALNGVDESQDILPSRFFEEPGSGTAHMAIPPIDKNDFLESRQRYYRIRGLDPKGRPLEDKALKLGLKWNSL